MKIHRKKTKPRKDKPEEDRVDTVVAVDAVDADDAAEPSGEYLPGPESWTLLKIGRANFYRRVRNGQLPPAAIRIGRLTRWSRTELLAAVSNRSK